MKRGLLIPAALLAAVLAFCLWNGAAMASHTARWQAQLEEAGRLGRAGDWEGTAAAIRDSRTDWEERQTYLRVVANHDALDGAEAMYRRAQSFAESREGSELQAELAGLRAQLRALSGMEELSLGNVL